MAREILRTALVPSAACLSTDELVRYADGLLGSAEQAAADAHVRGCLNCQAELALRQAVTLGEARPGEADVVREGAARLERRATEIFGAGGAGRAQTGRWFGLDTLPVAAAAVLALVAAGLYLRGDRAPELPRQLPSGGEVTRSLAVAVRG